jgi:hypothetical protein
MSKRSFFVLRNYYFVDANIVNRPNGITKLLEDSENLFFYTETKGEVKNIDSRFTFIDTKLSEYRKKTAIDLMKDGHNLTERQMNIIFEASSVQFREDVIPLEDLTFRYS